MSTLHKYYGTYKKITNLIFNLQPLSVCFTLLLSNIKTNKIYIIITFSDDRLWRLFLADARTRGNGVATPFSKQETKCFLILLVSKSALRSGVMVAHSNMKAAAYTPQSFPFRCCVHCFNVTFNLLSTS